MKCKTHPRYRAVRKPTAGCKVCRLLWYIQRLRKALGFSHAVARPRLDPIARIALKDANRVQDEIAQVLAAKSPYPDVVKGGNFPSGAGDTKRAVPPVPNTPAEVKALGAPWKITCTLLLLALTLGCPSDTKDTPSARFTVTEHKTEIGHPFLFTIKENGTGQEWLVVQDSSHVALQPIYEDTNTDSR